MAFSLALAFLAMIGLVSIFGFGGQDAPAFEPSPPPTLQPPATRLPTRALFEPTATATDAVVVQAPATATDGPPQLRAMGGDRLMGKAIEDAPGTGGTLVVGVLQQPVTLNPLIAG